MAASGHVPKCSVGANLVRNTFEGCHRRPGSLLSFDPIRGGKVYSQFYNGQPPNFDLTAQNEFCLSVHTGNFALPLGRRYRGGGENRVNREPMAEQLVGDNPDSNTQRRKKFS